MNQEKNIKDVWKYQYAKLKWMNKKSRITISYNNSIKHFNKMDLDFLKFKYQIQNNKKRKFK